MSSKVDEALASILASTQAAGCWASRLTGDAKALVQRLEEEEAKGTKVNRHAAARILSQTFGVKVAKESVRNHLAGSCSCKRPANG